MGKLTVHYLRNGQVPAQIDHLNRLLDLAIKFEALLARAQVYLPTLAEHLPKLLGFKVRNGRTCEIPCSTHRRSMHENPTFPGATLRSIALNGHDNSRSNRDQQPIYPLDWTFDNKHGIILKERKVRGVFHQCSHDLPVLKPDKTSYIYDVVLFLRHATHN